MNSKSGKGNVDLSQRAGGVLLHITSLPGPFGIGDLGPAAHQWIDLLAKAGQRWWQILPLGYTGEGGSPYRCYSAFAGNPLLISPEALVNDGLLKKSELVQGHLPPGSVDFAAVTHNKFAILKIAHNRFQQSSRHALATPFRLFLKAESNWLDDFALFMALQSSNPSEPWTSWPNPILRRETTALERSRHLHHEAFEFHRFIQFLFARQLRRLRDHARSKGVALVGDLPIFVSPESSDVWTNPKLFQLDRNFQPVAVAGVPPDMFSVTGQRWGNPLYNWDEMANDGFAWWKARLSASLQQADVVRIDHFRGMEAYWRIPASCPTAVKGKWTKVPGLELFEALLEGQSQLPLVAEDLGVITPEVERLRDRFGLPGMRVLQFGFSGEGGDIHTPHNFIKHCFAYTGTHDNDTTAGWFKSLRSSAKRRVEQYAPQLAWETDPAGSLTQLLWASTAGQAIVPVQDLLGLGSDARMNTPGKSTGNWNWRLKDFSSCLKPLDHLKQLTRVYGRGVSASAE